MYWDVKTVKPLPDFRIYVEIEDGRKGIFGYPFFVIDPAVFGADVAPTINRIS